MNNLNGGYVMIDVNANINVLRNQLDKALNLHKPCLVYDGNEVNWMSLKIDRYEGNPSSPRYRLECTDLIYFITPTSNLVQKISKNIKGEFAFDFIGQGIINAEIHDAYVKVTVTLWYSDENQSSKTFTSGDLFGSVTIPSYLKDNFTPVSYLLTGATYDETGEPITDPFYMTGEFDLDFLIKVDDGFTITPDDSLQLECTLYFVE